MKSSNLVLMLAKSELRHFRVPSLQSLDLVTNNTTNILTDSTNQACNLSYKVLRGGKEL